MESPLSNPVHRAIAEATRRLAAAGVPSPGFDARRLLRHALGWTSAELAAFAGASLPDAARRDFARVRSRFERLVEDRAARRPLQHLVGRVSFFGLDLAVSPGALIPRPDTETLVEAALVWATAREAHAGAPNSSAAIFLSHSDRCLASRGPSPLRIADVGCGSGAIALALASRIPTAQVLALDISTTALDLTARNAVATGLASRVDPVRADLLQPLADQSLDLVTANLPYVPSGEIPTLEPEVRDHEPRLALDGGPDGLDPLRRLAPMAARTLRPGGRLIIEIGAGQEPAARAIVCDHGFASIEIHQDLAGIPRVLSAGPPLTRTCRPSVWADEKRTTG